MNDMARPEDAADYFAGCDGLHGAGGILHDYPALQMCQVPTSYERIVAAVVASQGVIPAHVAAEGQYSNTHFNPVVDAPGALNPTKD